jgi:hypothetical protein
MTNAYPVVVRKASPADAETIAALTEAAYARYIPRLGRKPEPMTADYRQIVAEHPVWLLCLGDQPAGVLVLKREPEGMLIYSQTTECEHALGLDDRLLRGDNTYAAMSIAG